MGVDHLPAADSVGDTNVTSDLPVRPGWSTGVVRVLEEQAIPWLDLVPVNPFARLPLLLRGPNSSRERKAGITIGGQDQQ
jgi:hypothetical protein